MNRTVLPRWTYALLIGAFLGFAGCATVPDSRAGPGQRLDPWENWNRKVFAFNESVDEYVMRPIATAYTKIVPELLRRGVSNVFNNALDGWSAVNNVLQGKPEPAFNDFVRVTTNSVLGFGGLLDIASDFGLPHHYEDFGQTLGRWGFGPGAYLVWPFLGPSTVRDSIAMPLDGLVSPALLISRGSVSWGIAAIKYVNIRANLLGASALLDDIALDKYSFLRDAYLQRRRSLVFDGDAPPEPEDPAERAPENPPK